MIALVGLCLLAQGEVSEPVAPSAQEPALWVVLQDSDPAARLALVARLDAAGPLQASAWWWLVHDAERDVREAALERLGALCAEEGASSAACACLQPGLLDPERDLRWLARDGLIWHEPELALLNASREYKLDLLSRLTVAVERRGPMMPRVLELLWTDLDPQVAALAQTLVEITSP